MRRPQACADRSTRSDQREHGDVTAEEHTTTSTRRRRIDDMLPHDRAISRR
jgi:hypothetical protein